MTVAAGPDAHTGLVGWATGVVETLGGPGIAFLIALENVFPPIPSEVVLPLAGFAAHQGQLTVIEAVLWSTTGSLVGALALYGLGAAVGTSRLARTADRLPLLHARDVRRAEAWFHRRGVLAVLLGRWVPGLRSLVSVPAGAARMHLAVFCMFTGIGSAVWNTALVLAGYGLGTQWTRVGEWLRTVSTVGAVVLVTVAGCLFLRRWLARRDRRGPR